MLKRILFALLCIAPLTLSSVRAEDAPRNTKPFQRFKILLGGFLNDTIPFDVKFIIWGDIDPSMTENIGSAEVTLQIGELTAGTSCTDLALPNYSKSVSVRAKKWTDVEFKDRQLDIPTDAAATTRHQFEMIVSELEPKKIYCFLFQVGPGLPPTPEQEAALARALLPAYEEFLRVRGVQKELGEEQAEPLRQELIQALRSASPIRNLSPRPGTLFDPTAKPEQVAAEFRKRWTAVNSQHTRVVSGLREWNEFGPGSDNEQMLANWRQWSGVAARLSRFLPADVASEFQALASLRDDQLARVFVGLPEDGLDQPLSELSAVDMSVGPASKTPETDPCPRALPLLDRCTQIERTTARLRRLQASLSAAGPTLPGTMTAADKAALAQGGEDIETTVEDLVDRKADILGTQRAVNERHARIVEHVKALEVLIRSEWLSMATTHGSLETRRGWYISADTGLAVAPSINEILPYIGTNIYFWPVNTEAPPGPFRTRFSTLVGFTWTNNILKTGERASLYGTSVSLVLGAGIRLNEFVKISAGALTFKGLDPNPLVDNPRLRMTPFISLSGDIDMAKLLGGLFGADATPKTIGAGTTK